MKVPFQRFWQTAIFAKDEWKLLGNKPIVTFRWETETDAREGHWALASMFAWLPRANWNELSTKISFLPLARMSSREEVSVPEYLEKCLDDMTHP